MSGLRLTRRLGVGAHGQVWLASDPRTGDRVAVKLVRDDLSAEQARQAAERLASEAEMLGRVRHPHVITLRGTVDDALVLDHLPGGSVADLVAARGPLEPAEVTTVVVPIARALAALHAAGIVHGDVTAANVLLGSDGHPVLADLGAAVEARTGEGSASAAGRTRGRPAPPVLSPVVWGTPGWIDPVASLARPHPGQDIWGLGALVRFCLTATVVAEANEQGPPAADDGGGGPSHDPDGGRRAMLRVAQACCGDRQSRPGAEQVAAMLWQAASAAPIAMPLSVGPSAPELTRRIRVEAGAEPCVANRRRGSVLGLLRRRAAPGGEPWWGAARGRERGWAWPVAALAGGLTAGGVAALLILHSVGSVPHRPLIALPEPSGGKASAPPPRSPTPGPGDLGQVVARLAQARAAAISAGSTAALAEVDVPGSAAEAADRALLQRLAADGRSLVGLRFTVGPTTNEPAVGAIGAAEASVTTVVTTSAHTQVDSRTATILAAVPAGRPQRVRIALTRLAQGWRVSAVEPLADQS